MCYVLVEFVFRIRGYAKMNKVFTAQNLALIAEEKDDEIYVWFPPTKSLILISKKGLPNLKNESLIGQLCQITVRGHSPTPIKYENVKALNFSYPIPKRVNQMEMFSTINVDGKPSPLNIPVMIGNYLPSKGAFIGFNSFFGRIAVPAIAACGKINQFQVYTCDLTICLFGSLYCASCRWEVKRIKCISNYMPFVRIVTGTLRTILNDGTDFIFENSERPRNVDGTADLIHVNQNDFAEMVAQDLTLGTRIKLLCEARSPDNPLNCRERFPATAFYATLYLDRPIEYNQRPIRELPSLKTSDACCDFIQKMHKVVGMPKIRAVYPEKIADKFEKVLRCIEQIQAVNADKK